jgi:hypothetical protein
MLSCWPRWRCGCRGLPFFFSLSSYSWDGELVWQHLWQADKGRNSASIPGRNKGQREGSVKGSLLFGTQSMGVQRLQFSASATSSGASQRLEESRRLQLSQIRSDRYYVHVSTYICTSDFERSPKFRDSSRPTYADGGRRVCMYLYCTCEGGESRSTSAGSLLDLAANAFQ